MNEIIKNTNKLIDPFGRTVDYLRVSVTDRCDFRWSVKENEPNV